MSEQSAVLPNISTFANVIKKFNKQKVDKK